MIEKIAILDIDDTVKIAHMLSMGRIFGISKNVVDDLAKKQIKDLYFFSNMDLSDMGNGRIPSLPGSSPYVTRMDLVQFFESHGFTVHGVITAADIVYRRGLGAAYRDYYIPAYKECILNPIAYAENKKLPGSYQVEFNSMLEQVSASHGGVDSREGRAALNKAKMFNYLKEMLPETVSHIDYYEDDELCIKAIKEIDESVECHLVNDQATTPLYLTGSDAFDRVLALLEEEHTELNIFHARLSSQQLKITTLRELEQVLELCEFSADFKKRFDAAILEQGDHSNEFEVTVREMVEVSARNARSKLFTAVTNVIEGIDKEFYQLITTKPTAPNQSGFSIGFSEKTVFEYFPKMMLMFIGSHGDDLKHYLVVKTAELRALFDVMGDLSNSMMASAFNDDGYTPDKFLEQLSSILVEKRKLKLFNEKETPERVEEYKRSIISLLPMLGQCKNLVSERSYYKADVAGVVLDESGNEAVLIKKFMKRHIERLRLDKKKFGGAMFAHTNINPLDNLSKILVAALSKKGERKKLTCIEFHWLNEDGTVHDQAPVLIKAAYDHALVSMNQTTAKKPSRV